MALIYYGSLEAWIIDVGIVCGLSDGEGVDKEEDDESGVEDGDEVGSGDGKEVSSGVIEGVGLGDGEGVGLGVFGIDVLEMMKGSRVGGVVLVVKDVEEVEEWRGKMFSSKSILTVTKYSGGTFTMLVVVAELVSSGVFSLVTTMLTFLGLP
nr:hypothetical protein [Tanacetum cinerariifolium]